MIQSVARRVRLTFLSSFNNMKQKGPSSQRHINPNQVLKDKIRQEKEQQKYTQSLKNMYQSNYTPEEMDGANQMVRRVFKLENATPHEVLKYKIERAVNKFQKSPTDCGNAAVQCAVMSEKIISLMTYVKRFPKDFKSGKALTLMVQRRRSMLNYLMRTDFNYYRWVCTEYGIPEAFPKYAHHQTNFRGQVNCQQGI